MSNSFSFLYDSSSLRFGLLPLQFQNKMFKPMKVVKGYLSWMNMRYDGLVCGFRLLGDSLGGLLFSLNLFLFNSGSADKLQMSHVINFSKQHEHLKLFS